MGRLTQRQALFVLEYCKDFNPAAAYVRAGFSPRGAVQGAHRLLRNVDVSRAVADRRATAVAKLERASIATLAQVKERLTEQLREDRFTARIKRIEEMIQDAGLEVPKVIECLLEVERLRIASSAESGRAAVALARMKGAFDFRRPPLEDRQALVNMIIRNIIRAGISPGDVLKNLKAAATDVEVVPVEAGNP